MLLKVADRSIKIISANYSLFDLEVHIIYIHIGLLYPKLYRKHDLRDIMRIDLSKQYGNGVLFHKVNCLS